LMGREKGLLFDICTLIDRQWIYLGRFLFLSSSTTRTTQPPQK
jgi:hypothetical protein